MKFDVGAVWSKIVAEPLPEGFSRIKKATGSDRPASAQNGSAEAPGDLRASDPTDVAAALAALPNGLENARDRDEWISVLHSVAGATGGSEAGRELWLNWCRQWGDDDGANANAEKAWDSLDLAHVSIGWDWLKEHAAKEDDAFRLALAAEEFANDPDPDPVPLADDIFSEPATDLSDVLTAVDLMDTTPAGVQRVLRLMARSNLNVAAREMVVHRIKTKTGFSITTLRKQLDNEVRNLRRDSPDVEIRLANYAHNHFGRGLIAHYHGAWFLFTGRHWERQPDEKFITDMLAKSIERDNYLLMNDNGVQAHSTSMVRGGLHLLAAQCATTLAPRDDFDFAIRNAVNLRNGTLWIDDQGNATLTKHDPRNCFTETIDIDYDVLATGRLYDDTLADAQSLTFYDLEKKADPEDWARVNEQVGDATEDAPVTLADGRIAWHVAGSCYRVVNTRENCRLVNEIAGYALVPNRFAQAVICLKGNGSNAKSAFIELLTARMGSLVFSTSVDSMQSRFLYSQLGGRTILAMDEGSETDLPSHRFKELSEHRELMVDFKGSAFRKIIIHVLQIVNTNSHLPVRDPSGGMRRRLIVVPFNRKYPQTEWINSPWAKIVADENEMSAALNRWIDGLCAVVKRKYLAHTKASVQALNEWTNRNIAEQAFIDAWCTRQQPNRAKSDGETLEDLHRAFLSWSALNDGGSKFAHGKRKFSETLQKLECNIYVSGGISRVRALWLDPGKIEMPGFAQQDFEPILDDPLD